MVRRPHSNPRPQLPPRTTPEQQPPVDCSAFQSPWVQVRISGRHPLIYQRMVLKRDPAAASGDVVSVYDKAGRRLGRGLFHATAPISVRMLATGERTVDDAFWRDRLALAIDLRRRLQLDAATDAYRLVHAEGDGLSGLVVERYADHLVFEHFSLGMFRRAEMIAALLAELLGPPTALDRPDRAAGAWQVIHRADEAIEKLEGFSIATGQRPMPRGELGETPSARSTLVIREHGVRYRVDPRGGHKTGFFCDQRDNRRRLAGLCRDASVLDLCCYTGGFGLCAAKLGAAREVTGVDLDENAVALARENANLNQVRIDHVHSDAFTFVRQMIANGRRFDVVILDPPKLATSRPALEEALRKYHDLNSVAMQVVRPGGLMLTCSCSGLVGRDEFIETVHRAAQRAGRTLQLLDYAGAAADHPVALDCPESAYLKAAWLRVN